MKQIISMNDLIGKTISKVFLSEPVGPGANSGNDWYDTKYGETDH